MRTIKQVIAEQRTRFVANPLDSNEDGVYHLGLGKAFGTYSCNE